MCFGQEERARALKNQWIEVLDGKKPDCKTPKPEKPVKIVEVIVEKTPVKWGSARRS